MRRSLAVALVVAVGLLVGTAGTALAQKFTYKPAGKLQSGTAGRPTNKIWIPGMRFPLRQAPAYANSQVWGHGGSQGPGGSQCDTANYSYPWWDNYCEPRKWDMPLCPGGDGHQGQDIRPKSCSDAKHWAVAAEKGTIIDDSGTAIKLKTPSGRTHRYLHMAPSTVVVDVGDELEPGDKIGKVSDYTGGKYPTTIHLHYDIRQYVKSDPKSGASVGESAFVPLYPSLVESYKRLIGQGGSGGAYDAKLEVRILGGEDRYTGGSSKDVPDYFPGETVEAALYLKNTGRVNWPSETWLGYQFGSPYLQPTHYRIDSDHPEHDRSTWSRNSADSADANPDRDRLDADGKLLMHAFTTGETKRIRLKLRAGPYSIGAVDHPDVRSWMWKVDGLYETQKKFRGDPSSLNSFGSRIRDYAQIDILSRDHWHFAGGDSSGVEGWSAGEQTAELKRNVGHDALAQAVDAADPRLVSPKWTTIQADRWPQIVLRLRSHNGPHDVAIHWKRGGEQFRTTRRVQFRGRGDGSFRTYVVPIAEHPEWSGAIKRLRVDQLQGAAPAGEESQWYDLADLFLQSPERRETNSRRESYVEQSPVDVEIPGSDENSNSGGSTVDAGSHSDAGTGGGSSNSGRVTTRTTSSCSVAGSPRRHHLPLWPFGLLALVLARPLRD